MYVGVSDRGSLLKLLIVITDFVSNSYLILAQKPLNLHNAIVRSLYFLCLFSEP